MSTVKGQATIENRLFPRKCLKLMVNYQCVDEQEDYQTLHQSVAQDFGLGGISITASERLEIGQLIMLTLFLPPQSRIHHIHEEAVCNAEVCAPVNALSRVAWCRAHYPENYIMGIQFLHLVQDDRLKVEAFAKQVHIHHGDS